MTTEKSVKSPGAGADVYLPEHPDLNSSLFYDELRNFIRRFFGKEDLDFDLSGDYCGDNWALHFWADGQLYHIDCSNPQKIKIWKENY